MVMNILAEELTLIHAFELKTWTMEVWEKKKPEFGI
jgi:stress-induced morphogen